jgi:sulfite exporter TauE/SafE
MLNVCVDRYYSWRGWQWLIIGILPSQLSKTPSIGILYVTVFSLGVLLNMLIFGLLMGQIQQKLF